MRVLPRCAENNREPVICERTTTDCEKQFREGLWRLLCGPERPWDGFQEAHDAKAQYCFYCIVRSMLEISEPKK